MKLIRWSGLVLICTLTVIPMNGLAHAQTNQTNMSSVHTDIHDTQFENLEMSVITHNFYLMNRF